MPAGALTTVNGRATASCSRRTVRVRDTAQDGAAGTANRPAGSVHPARCPEGPSVPGSRMRSPRPGPMSTGTHLPDAVRVVAV